MGRCSLTRWWRDRADKAIERAGGSEWYRVHRGRFSRHISWALVTLGVVTGTAVAQSDDGSGTTTGDITIGVLTEALINALRTLLKGLFTPIEAVIEAYGNDLLNLMVGTPHPDAIFQTPTTVPWIQLHQYYWSMIVPLTLLLFGLAVGLVILLEATSHLFSGYHRANLKRRGVSGLFGVLSWWWVAGASLQLTDQLTQLLLPDLSAISLFQTVSFSSIGLLGLVVTLSTDFGLFVLLALIYFARRLALFGFVLGMPLLMVAWIPGVGPLHHLARFAKRLAGFYVPFLVMPIPIALLLRLAAILGDAAELSMGGLGAWLTALVIPFVALIVPIVLFWQAGAVLFVGDRILRRTSRRRLQARASGGREWMAQRRHEGRNLLRGLRGDRSINRDGQTTLRTGPTQSRSHQLGGRLRSAGSRLRGLDTHGSSETTVSEPDRDRFEPREFDRTGTQPTLFDYDADDGPERTDSTTDRTDE